MAACLPGLLHSFIDRHRQTPTLFCSPHLHCLTCQCDLLKDVQPQWSKLKGEDEGSRSKRDEHNPLIFLPFFELGGSVWRPALAPPAAPAIRSGVGGG